MEDRWTKVCTCSIPEHFGTCAGVMLTHVSPAIPQTLSLSVSHDLWIWLFVSGLFIRSKLSKTLTFCIPWGLDRAGETPIN